MSSDVYTATQNWLALVKIISISYILSVYRKFMLKIVSLLILIISVSIAPIASAQVATSSNVPGWIKNTAGWWADGTIDENTFVQAVQWLVSNNIIDIPPTTVSSAADTTIPNWVKNTAGWWANSVILSLIHI